MSWVESLLVSRRDITRAAVNNLLCLDTVDAENYILDFVTWIVLYVSIRLARQSDKWEEVNNLLIIIDIFNPQEYVPDLHFLKFLHLLIRTLFDVGMLD